MKRPVSGVIFDLDGTLTKPVIDFSAMRRRLGIPEGDILAAVRSWPEERCREGMRVIEEIEEQALRDVEFQEGAREIAHFLADSGIKLGMLTRNSRRSAEKIIAMLGVLFDPVLTREFGPVKPNPEPVRFICDAWACPPRSVLVVGDYRDDITCGRTAGCMTCLLVRESNAHYMDDADMVIRKLSELRDMIQPYDPLFEGSSGGYS